MLSTNSTCVQRVLQDVLWADRVVKLVQVSALMNLQLKRQMKNKIPAYDYDKH